MRYFLNYCPKAIAMFNQRGFLFTSRMAFQKIHQDFHEWKFDKKWDVDTREVKFHPHESLNPLHLEAEAYQATTPMLFKEIMQATKHILLPETFYDIGCGKGRVLFMASLYGFKRIVGVEFDPDLAETARANISRFNASQKKTTRFEVHCQDAGAYIFSDVNAVIFLFNPFKEKIMINMLENIRRSASLTNERYIIYHNPVLQSLMSDPNKFEIVVKGKYFSVYKMII
jgi:SAM-dependent methyltransferase